MLEGGRQATKLAMSVPNQASFVLYASFSLKTMPFADSVIEEADSVDDDDDAVIFLENDVLLLTQCLAEVITGLLAAKVGVAIREVTLNVTETPAAVIKAGSWLTTITPTSGPDAGGVDAAVDAMVEIIVGAVDIPPEPDNPDHTEPELEHAT